MCIYTYIYTYVFMHMYTYSFTHIDAYMTMHECIHVFQCAWSYACIPSKPVCNNTDIHHTCRSCIQHTCMHTYTHTYVL